VCDISVEGVTYHYINLVGGSEHIVGIFSDGVSARVHECSHLTFNILNHAGINAVDSEEAYCYLVGFLYEKLFI
jgi:hypothetical protein